VQQSEFSLSGLGKQGTTTRKETADDGLIANLSYHFNRNYGLLTRLQTAIGDDLTLAADSLLTRKLKNDARALRTLAQQIDAAAKKLTRL
jgi:hypothetical protein